MKGKERKNTGKVGGRANGERELSCSLHAKNGKVGGEAEEGRKISMLKRRMGERKMKEETFASLKETGKV